MGIGKTAKYRSVWLVLWLSVLTTALGGQTFLRVDEGHELNKSHKSQGIATADYDMDGDLDVYIVAMDADNASSGFGFSKLYRNDQGRFVDVTTEAGLDYSHEKTEPQDQTLGVKSGASWGDFDNDGDPDLFLANDGYDRLFSNNGDGTFTDITDSAGVAGCYDCYSSGGAWFDYDKDGDLDIYVTRYIGVNAFFLNNGDGTFNEIADQIGLDDTEHTWSVMPIDMDEDGDFDLYLSNDNGPNRLMLNIDGIYEDFTEEYGLGNTGNGMGISLSDYDFNGIPEIYVTNIHSNQPNPFFIYNEENKIYEDRAEEFGLEDTGWGWDIAIIDADHDLDEDIAVATYGNSDFNFFFRNEPTNDGRDFVDFSRRSGIALSGGSFGLASFDYDLDGDIDLLYSNRLDHPFLLENLTISKSNHKNWVQLNLEGTTSNRDAYGAKVELTVGDKVLTRWYNGIGVARQSKKPVHFGLDDIDNIDHLVITWPNGLREEYDDLGVNMQYSFKESEGFTSRELAGSVDRTSIDFDLSKSIARVWMEELLHAIRNDFARPTVHARNLHHVSTAMYEILAAYDANISNYFMGELRGGMVCEFDQGRLQFGDKDEAIREALSYAAYRLIAHRFRNSPGAVEIRVRIEDLMSELGFDINDTSTDYQNDGPLALGNYVAECIIEYGLNDGASEQTDYGNAYYEPFNTALDMSKSGNPNVTDPNRWQPLTLSTFIDQSGNVVGDNTPDFLSPEWGNVVPFSLSDNVKTTYSRDGDNYNVFHDPGTPPLLNVDQGDGLSDEYKWGFSMVATWAAHLSPGDGVMIDISPASLGNIDLESIPDRFEDYDQFYDYLEGGDTGTGYSSNPATGRAYEPNVVPRGDYARVLAEFWADGPDSETPPGHWFTILNHVNDHPDLIKKLGGEGEVRSDLDWDIISYFILGGAMHDAAISAWSIKGYYDYIRPVSAIRYMADQGQSTDPEDMSYSVNGIPLVQGYIELVREGDPLAGDNGQNIGKIKLYSWKGPDFIQDEETDEAGVDWILAEDWWPYQRPSFVTPPFAGYISGHSTYSRAAAEVLTRITGDPYFPGGVGEFVAKKDEFLVFEDGPSTDVVLQWATYRDASDQCSLSRIWGGIHPPADDLPGRKIGFEIGNRAFEYAMSFVGTVVTSVEEEEVAETFAIYPNPNAGEFILRPDFPLSQLEKVEIIDYSGRAVAFEKTVSFEENQVAIKLADRTTNLLIVRVLSEGKMTFKKVVLTR